MTPADLRAWRKAHGFRSQQSLAARLGIAWRTVNNYESGETPIPVQFRYALAAIQAGLDPL
jgi:transcriptional regulator with XRE-family HTH domain